MAAIIKIKRSGSNTAPSQLAQGEMAYSFATGGNKLYIGTGNENNGVAAAVTVIGGNYYTNLLDVTAAGTTDASKALIVDADKALDVLTIGDLKTENSTITALGATNADVDIDLAPKNQGAVQVPTGYMNRTNFGTNSLVTKEYVDAHSSGLDVKESVRAATTSSEANITISNPGFTAIDGVNLSNGDRVLVKNQSTTASENGIYIFNGSASAMTRADDFVTGNVDPGAFCFVEEGTVNGDSGFVLSTNGAITVGTTALAFTQFSGAGSFSAGAGLSQTGTTFEVDFDDSTIGLDTNNKLAVKASGTQYQVIVSGAGTASPAWGALPLNQSAAVSGTLPTSRGGTGLTTGSLPKGAVLYTDADNSIAALDGGGAADQVLTYDSGNDVVAWSTALSVTLGGTGLNSITKGSVLVANTDDTLSALDGGGISDKLLKYNTNDTISWTSSIGVGLGGTGLTSYAQGDMVFASSTTSLSTISSSGHAGKFLIMNSSETAPEWTNIIDGDTF